MIILCVYTELKLYMYIEINVDNITELFVRQPNIPASLLS
jgi:hypothetical protein